MKIKKRRCNRK